MRFSIVGLCGVIALGCGRAEDIELGQVDRKAPVKKDLTPPKKDDGIAVVSLKAVVSGTVPAAEKRNIYVVVNPAGNRDTVDVWWVQQEVSRSGTKVSADAQFGDESAGVGEYFAVLVIATDKKWDVGQMLTGLPEGAAATKLRFVKRK